MIDKYYFDQFQKFNNVNNLIRPQIIGMNPAEQGKIDQIMLALDGTQNKSKLGSN